MRNKKLYSLAMAVTVSLLLFTGCGDKGEPVTADPESQEYTNENGYPIDQTSGTGDTSGEIVEAEKPVEEGNGNNGSDVAGMDNLSGMTDDEINAEAIDTVDSIEASDFEIIPMDDTTMYCTSNSANIRKGPNTEYEKVGTLSYAQEITVNGKVESDGSTWYVIKTDNSDNLQMVSGSLLSTTKPQPQQPTSQPSSGNTNNTSTQQPSGETQQPSGGGQPSSGGNGGLETDDGAPAWGVGAYTPPGSSRTDWGGLQ